MGKIFKDALVLMAFSLVLGFVLGGVYKITEPIIAEATLRKEMEAYKVVFENADTFNQKEVDASIAGTVQASYPDVIDKVFEAVDTNGTCLGYVVQLTTKDGFSGGIVMIVGIQSDGAIAGVSVVSHQESPGFGADILNSSYLDQFKGVAGSNVNSVALVGGVTITSVAVQNGVNAAVAYATALAGGAQ